MIAADHRMVGDVRPVDRRQFLSNADVIRMCLCIALMIVTWIQVEQYSVSGR